MKPTLIVATVVLLMFAWMFRYDVIMGGSSRMVLKLDRWTGALYILNEDVGWERIDARPEYKAVEVPEKPAAK